MGKKHKKVVCKEQCRHHYVELPGFCAFAKKDDTITAMEWSNGEGYTISIDTPRDPRVFHLTLGEFEALRTLISSFDD